MKNIVQNKLSEVGISNLISILAVAIALFSWFNSCESNKISHEAVKIAKTTELPYFKASLNITDNKDEILFYNEGGLLRELENPEIYYFWNIESDKSLQNGKEIVVINYYNLGSRDILLPSNIPVAISAEAPAKAKNLIEEFKKLAKENDFLVFMSAKWYVRLQYKDIYDEYHDDMYDVSPKGARKVSKNEAEELIKKYTQKIGHGMFIDMSTVSPEVLYEKWQRN